MWKQRMIVRQFVVCLVVALVAVPGMAWAQPGQSSASDKPRAPGTPPAVEQGIRFDDAQRSGAPCAVPGICGRCDCPKLPASPVPGPGSGRDPKSGK
jgi:hypothetical protein